MLLTNIWIVRKTHILKIQKTVLKMTVKINFVFITEFQPHSQESSNHLTNIGD